MAVPATTAGDRGELNSRDLARLLGGGPGAAAWQWFGGHAFGVVGDLEPLRTLFEVEGCTVAVARVDEAGQLRLALRQVTLYRDPANREVLERWRNPYTGRELAVAHQHLPGVRVVYDEGGPRAHWLGTGARASVFLEDHGVSHFPLVPAAAPGGAQQRATSSAQLVASRAALSEAGAAAIGYVGAWQVLADWPEWLAMGGQPGYLFQRVFVRKADSRDELPLALREAITRRFADGLDPPGGG